MTLDKSNYREQIWSKIAVANIANKHGKRSSLKFLHKVPK